MVPEIPDDEPEDERRLRFRSYAEEPLLDDEDGSGELLLPPAVTQAPPPQDRPGNA
ncbi:hypothetical protein [Actinomadura madurae]|uniref:hypothetical protein n=1 Tax=Actinomadura madurae TaxID=1993 RepID=UPI002025E221|nr:hypothetical protein [Actinomadura madurae]MCP9954908.1 hypothetical protein [Actinomadura madurae]MCP9971651.1 hypothetical protein [Actinomadura madurae]MCP9984144.1 hypothetical protein [Actinomadura madurae]MCQ0004297.1 hypothetical protein [Actinomadura madurae]URN00390.1 hypothetical protein LUW76_42165 [Actinomadura madurae]